LLSACSKRTSETDRKNHVDVNSCTLFKGREDDISSAMLWLCGSLNELREMEIPLLNDLRDPVARPLLKAKACLLAVLYFKASNTTMWRSLSGFR